MEVEHRRIGPGLIWGWEPPITTPAAHIEPRSDAVDFNGESSFGRTSAASMELLMQPPVSVLSSHPTVCTPDEISFKIAQLKMIQATAAVSSPEPSPSICVSGSGLLAPPSDHTTVDINVPTLPEVNEPRWSVTDELFPSDIEVELLSDLTLANLGADVATDLTVGMGPGNDVRDISCASKLESSQNTTSQPDQFSEIDFDSLSAMCGVYDLGQSQPRQMSEPAGLGFRDSHSGYQHSSHRKSDPGRHSGVLASPAIGGLSRPPLRVKSEEPKSSATLSPTVSAATKQQYRKSCPDQLLGADLCGKGARRSRSLSPRPRSRDNSPTRSKSPRRRHKHVCKYCAKIMETKYKLERHLRTHTGERPFECEKCNAKFNQKSSLKTHSHIHARELLRNPTTTKEIINATKINGYTLDQLGVSHGNFRSGKAN